MVFERESLGQNFITASDDIFVCFMIHFANHCLNLMLLYISQLACIMALNTTLPLSLSIYLFYSPCFFALISSDFVFRLVIMLLFLAVFLFSFNIFCNAILSRSFSIYRVFLIYLFVNHAHF